MDSKNNERTDIYFLLSPDAHLLDLAGPCQAFHEAQAYGLDIKLHYIGVQQSISSHQGLTLANIAPLPSSISDNAIIIVCASSYCESIYLNKENLANIEWLRNTPKSCTKIVGICTGAFLVGLAGWLEGRSCTTHHKLTTQLAQKFPSALVLPDRIFVKDGQIYTSAGVTAGIDTTLQLIQEHQDASFSMEIARELVVYRRRMPNDPQISKQIGYRNHISPLVHSIQDHLQSYSGQKILLTEIAQKFRVSLRHMQREFKNATGMTISQYLVELRLEEAKSYINRGDSFESAAYKSGFPQAKALRTAWKKKYQSLPS
ncbi:GlxA family transcriptional regulator [Vibrio jasicida]|uniref:GlxA family transcriptional regulator n=1 Tax=Vibrio jasicida TaxID=766224 RepID=UPI0040691E72